jgi:RNA polymerase sigma-70 factor, ECF subfamily
VESDTDGDVIRRSRRDPQVFEVIFERHYEAVRIYAQRRLGNIDGEEIAASTFELAFAQRDRFDDATYSSARPWLIGVANNLVRHHVRRQEVQRRSRPISIALDPTETEPNLDGVEALETRPMLRAALESLSPEDRETFLLVVLADLSYQEVAEVLGVPVGTVRSRIHRARRRLRELLGRAGAISPGTTNDQGDRDE